MESPSADSINIDNVVVVQNSNESYSISYELTKNKKYNFLDCECSLLSENGSYMGYGKTILDNSSNESNLNIVCNATLDSNFSSSNETPKKIKIYIFDEEFNSNLKDEKGYFAQKPIYSKTISL